jgi:hypothetical protein
MTKKISERKNTTTQKTTRPTHKKRNRKREGNNFPPGRWYNVVWGNINVVPGNITFPLAKQLLFPNTFLWTVSSNVNSPGTTVFLGRTLTSMGNRTTVFFKEFWKWPK